MGLQREPLLETDQHRELRALILDAVSTGRRFVVAIDGPVSSGKSSLARYLGWQLAFAVVETDLFMETVKPLQHRTSDLNSVVNAERISDRPIIVEGLQVLQILDTISVRPDFLILMQRKSKPYSMFVDEQCDDYRIANEDRLARADFHYRW